MAKREAQVVVTLKDRASKGLRKLGSVAGGLAKAFGVVTAAAGAVAGALTGKFLFDAIRNTGSFQEAMSSVGAVTGATSEQLAQLEATARQAGASTRFSASEAAAGLEELARAGQSSEEAISTLVPVLDLAAGNNQSVAESAVQVTTAINAFGLSAEEAARVSDVYTRAAQRSAQTTGQLSEAMTFVAPVARQAGLDIEQTAAIVGRLSDAGFRGSMAGTALRNAILQFEDPGSNFREQLKAIGIETDDFNEALYELADAGSGGEAAIRSLGLRAGPAIQAVVAGGVPALKELIGELRNSAGAAEDAAAEMNDNLPGALRALGSAYQETQIALTEPLVERIQEEIEAFTEKLRAFSQSEIFGEIRRTLVETFDAARTAISEFVKGIDFEEVKTKLSDLLSSTRESLGQFQETTTSFVSGFDKIVGASQMFVGTMSTAFNGLGIIFAKSREMVVSWAAGVISAVDKASLGLLPGIDKLKKEILDLQVSSAELTASFIDNAAASGEQISAGFDRWASAGEQAGDRVAEGMKKAGDSIDENVSEKIPPAEERLSSLQTEMFHLGASAESLGLGGKTAGEGIDAAGEAAERASVSIGKINGEWVELENSTARATGSLGEVTAAGDEASAAFKRLSDRITVIPTAHTLKLAREDLERMAAAGDLTEEQVRELTAALEAQEAQLARQSDKMGEAAESTSKVGQAAQGATEEVDGLSESTEKAGSKAVALAKAWNAAVTSWGKFSEGAQRTVDAFTQQMSMGVRTVSGFLGRMADFSSSMAERQERQERVADRLIRQHEELGLKIGQANQAQALLNSSVLLLDDSRVQALKEAVGQARQEMDSARESSEQLVASLEEDLLRLQGKTAELEQRRLDRQREEIKLQLRSNEIDLETRRNLEEALRLIDQKARIRAQEANTQEAQLEAERKSLDLSEEKGRLQAREADAQERQLETERKSLQVSREKRQETDAATGSMSSAADTMERAFQKVRQGEIRQHLVVEFRRDQAEAVVLSEDQITRIADRVLDAIELDKGRAA